MNIKTVLCITGASGSIYGLKLCKFLSQLGEVDLIISSSGYEVIKEEVGLKALNELGNNVNMYEEKDFTSPVASGSRIHEYKGIIVAPCSMSTLACIANGINKNLIHRVCEVALKERIPLVLLVREMPYSVVHLENMLKVSKAGAIVMPASPAFYTKPKSIEDMINFVIGKILDVLGIKHSLYKRWKEET